MSTLEEVAELLGFLSDRRDDVRSTLVHLCTPHVELK